METKRLFSGGFSSVILFVLFTLWSVRPALSPAAQTTAQKEKGKPSTSRYLIMASHTTEGCLKAMDEVSALGPKALAKFDWGCMAGDHTAYAIVEAASESAARDLLPASERSKAKVVKVEKLTVEQIKSFHEMAKKK